MATPPPAMVVRLLDTPLVDPDPTTGALDMLDITRATSTPVRVFVRGVFPVRSRAFDYAISTYTMENGIVYPHAVGMRPTATPEAARRLLALFPPADIDKERMYLDHGQALVRAWQGADFEYWDECPARAGAVHTPLEACVVAAVTRLTIYQDRLWCLGAELAKTIVPRGVSDADFVKATADLIRRDVLARRGADEVGLAYETDCMAQFLRLVDELNARPIVAADSQQQHNMSYVMFFKSNSRTPRIEEVFPADFTLIKQAERMPVDDTLLNLLTTAKEPIVFVGNPLLRRPHMCTATMVPWPESALPKGRIPATITPAPRIEFVAAMKPTADVTLTSDLFALPPRTRCIRTVGDEESFDSVAFIATAATTPQDLARAQSVARTLLVVVDLDLTGIPQRASFLDRAKS